MQKKINYPSLSLNKFALLLGVLLSNSMTYATSMATQDFLKSWTPFINLNGGPAWTNSHKTQTFYLTPFIENTYASADKTSTLGLGELFLGLQTPLRASVLWQIGLVLGLTGNASLNGDIWEEADPEFNNFNYSYQVNHYLIDLKTRFILTNLQIIQPYISGSLGVGFNHSTNFTSVSKIPEESPALGFEPSTITTLTYTIGVGLQKKFSLHWHANMEYEFSDWGKSALAKAPWQTINSGLSLNHLYTNALLFGLTYTA